MTAREVVLGVDLGTTFSSAAAWVDGQLHIITDSRGDACFPSAVFFPERGDPQVGDPATKKRATHPSRTVTGVKRILGRAFDSDETRLLSAHTAFTLRPAPNGQVVVDMNGEVYSATQIASLIYRHLRERAETMFGRKISRAVMTLPVKTPRAVEDATLLAARMAGFEEIRTIPEPCAGALAHRIHRYDGRRKLMVYDFGGGTFDVTILEQRGNDFQALANAGDYYLGGDGFDQALGQLVLGQIWRQHQVDLSRDVVTWDRVIVACEHVKRGLSAADSVLLSVPDAFTSAGRRRDLELLINRKDAESRWIDFATRSMQVSAQAMLDAQLRPKDLQMVLLVGGTTYIPLIRSFVERVMGRPGIVGADPQTAVAVGAAIVGSGLIALA